jgi:hypothetical protein
MSRKLLATILLFSIGNDVACISVKTDCYCLLAKLYIYFLAEWFTGSLSALFESGNDLTVVTSSATVQSMPRWIWIHWEHSDSDWGLQIDWMRAENHDLKMPPLFWTHLEDGDWDWHHDGRPDEEALKMAPMNWVLEVDCGWETRPMILMLP